MDRYAFGDWPGMRLVVTVLGGNVRSGTTIAAPCVLQITTEITTIITHRSYIRVTDIVVATPKFREYFKQFRFTEQ